MRIFEGHLLSTPFIDVSQANNSDIQNVSAPPFEVDNSSCIPDQNCRATANEAKENVDQHGARNADTSSMHTMGNDPIVATNILHQTTTVNGIPNFSFFIEIFLGSDVAAFKSLSVVSSSSFIRLLVCLHVGVVIYHLVSCFFFFWVSKI